MQIVTFVCLVQENCSHKPYNRLASEAKFMCSSKWEKENLAAVAINKLWNMGLCLGSWNINEKLYSQAKWAVQIVLYMDIYVKKKRNLCSGIAYLMGCRC